MARTKIGKAVEGLKDIAVDMSSLQVKTYTGEYDVDLQGGNLEEILSKAKAAQGSKIKLIAFTDIRIDGDVTTFIPTIPGGESLAVDQTMLDVHNMQVEAAQETRAKMVEAFTSILDIIPF